MSRQYERAAARLKGPTPAATWVLRTLAAMAGPDGRAWPNSARLADQAHVSQRVALKALRDLEAAGLIERQKQPPSPRGVRRPDVLRLTFAPDDRASGLAGQLESILVTQIGQRLPSPQIGEG